ncbi:hypothetical protein EB796_022800 [Bugula neritina]|uniref:G-protein coupled receptors family 2 profile 2 domain-containing protein n=1 Tax=Bugula neritina TaxID=10212 RepID=A0A7J7IYM8_BUGNE|nr:hypothetical protein EB796_022800 [Bugula neritina]
MLQCIINIIIFEPYVKLGTHNYSAERAAYANRVTYIELDWLCKTLFTLSYYFSMTNIFWAFVEGLFLMSRISIAVFSNKTPYALFHLIGWGLPAVFTLAWALCMHAYQNDQQCWRDPTDTPYFTILQVPALVTVAANLIFLICIIRILVTKLYAVTTDEHVQVRKAMKATIVLLPLLSITSILFIWAPDLETTPNAHEAYRIITACFQVAQGILVSVLFCFLNGEVRSALVKHWKQWQSETFRYRSSRASSVCVTQSEHLVISGGSQIRRLSHTSHVSAAAPGEVTGTAV